MSDQELVRCRQCERAMCRQEATLTPRDQPRAWFCSEDCADQWTSAKMLGMTPQPTKDP